MQWRHQRNDHLGAARQHTQQHRQRAGIHFHFLQARSEIEIPGHLATWLEVVAPGQLQSAGGYIVADRQHAHAVFFLDAQPAIHGLGGRRLVQGPRLEAQTHRAHYAQSQRFVGAGPKGHGIGIPVNTVEGFAACVIKHQVGFLAPGVGAGMRRVPALPGIDIGILPSPLAGGNPLDQRTAAIQGSKPFLSRATAGGEQFPCRAASALRHGGQPLPIGHLFRGIRRDESLVHRPPADLIGCAQKMCARLIRHRQ